MPIDDSETLIQGAQRVAANSAVVFLGQVATLGANAVFTIILARTLGQNRFGLFSYALVFVGIFAIIADFGMQTILVREIARPRWKPAELLGNAVIIKIILSFLAIIITIIVAWLAGYPQELFVIIIILALSIPVTYKFYTLRAIFEAHFNASLKMTVPILCQLLDSLLLVGITYKLAQSGAGLEKMVIGYVLSNLPGLVLTIYAAARRVPFRFAINKELSWFLLRESFPLWIYTILVTISGSVDVLFLRELRGESAVGLYSAALRLTSPLLFIPQGIVVSLFPLLSRYHEQSDEKLTIAFHLGMKAILLLALTLAIATTFLGSEVIKLLYSDEFSGSAKPLIILMWSQAFFFLSFFVTNTLTSVNQQQIPYYAAAAMLLTNVIASWILIQAFGVQGAAIAKLVSIIVGAAVLFFAISRILVLHLDQLLVRTSASCICFAGIMALLNRAQIGIAIIGPVGLVFTLVTIWSAFNRQERLILLSSIRASVSKCQKRIY